MQVFNANYFEDYSSYLSKNKVTACKKKPQKSCRKKTKEKILKHNSEKMELAHHYAEDMKEAPSELEKKMQQFLDRFGIQYEFQKVINIKKKNGKISKFYIADFYIPSKNLIIETDGAFHDNQVEKDNYRTEQIKKQHPNIRIIRWRWHDFDSYAKQVRLLKEVK